MKSIISIHKANSQRLGAIATFLIAATLLSGCASQGGGRNANIIGGSALGSIIAHEASNGDLAWTAGGAAVGALTAIASNSLSERNEQREYRAGYEAALNQSVKQQYWIIQNRQKEDAFTDQAESSTFVPIVVPEQRINGEIRNEHIIYVRAK